MNMKKKTIALLCLIPMLMSVFTACGGDKPGPANTTNKTEESVTTQDLNDVEDIPSDLNYNDREFTVLGWSGGGEIDFSSDSSDKISNKIFKRNSKVEQRLGVVLNFDTSMNGSNANRKEYLSTVERNLWSGVKYDLIACYSMTAANLAMDDCLEKLSSFSQIHFEKNWWASNVQDNCNLNGNVYFASGAISPSTVLQTMIIAANMETVTSHGLEDPRYLVDDGRWTMEAFFNMVKDVGVDQGDVGKDKDDIFGFAVNKTMFDAFLASNGLQTIAVDDEGDMIIDKTFYSEITNNLVDTLKQKLGTGDFWYPGDDTAHRSFSAGKSMMTTTTFETLRKIRSDIHFDYAYLPFPKASVEQKEYYSTIGFPYSMWSIPKEANDTECSAYVLECLAIEGYREVMPEVYSAVKYQYSNSPLNVSMFDIILASQTFDRGRVFNDCFTFSKSLVYTFRGSINGQISVNKSFLTSMNEQEGYINGILADINGKFDQ